ncbi:MAG TPA: isoprenylcysteine carboxylmethyltransferase family protein [Planctomycetota bacterium]|nr:isoprenylcysteine carboxylmethyltransferase family protein [Planctomycetota bacterium]
MPLDFVDSESLSHASSGLFGEPVLAMETTGSAWSDGQIHFWISIARLACVTILPGLVWLLWNSTFLTERKRNAAIIAGMVRLLFSLCADLALVHAGVYRYALDTMLYQGVPVDVHITYGCLLGTALCLIWEQAGSLRLILLTLLIAGAIMWNRWLVNSAGIITPLAPEWQRWDIPVQCALPVITVIFYKLVDENRALMLRSVVYAFGYFAVFYFLIPSMILSSTTLGEVIFPAAQWRTAVVAICVLSVPGAWAAGQFAVSGRGTPLPLDPTHKLIVTGPYAFVRNPMQISGLGVAIVWAVTTSAIGLWIYVAVLFIAMQFTKVHEEDNLHRRFGDRYKKYCRNVWLWIPRLWPYEEE